MTKHLLIILLFCNQLLFANSTVDNLAHEATKSFGVHPASAKDLKTYVSSHLSHPDSIARFYFTWIAKNINYNYDLEKKILEDSKYYIYEEQINDSITLATGKALCLGFSHLYATFLSQHGIECKMIEGYTKDAHEYLKGKEPIVNHVWNAYKSGNNWRLVEVTWASTTLLDEKAVDYFFFNTPPELFVLSHLPRNSTWQLLSTPLTKQEFADLPFISTDYFSYFELAQAPKLFRKDGKLILVNHLDKNWKIKAKVVTAHNQIVEDVKSKRNKKSGSIQCSVNPNLSGNYLRMDAVKKSFWNGEYKKIEALAYFMLP